MPHLETDKCGRCKKWIWFNLALAYQEKDRGVICPACIKRIIDPMRKSLGKMPIFISPNAYGESNE